MCWERGQRVHAWIGNPCPYHGNQHDTVKLLGDEPVDITIRPDWSPDPKRVAKVIACEIEANSLGDMKGDIAELKEDVSEPKEDVAGISEDVAKLSEVPAQLQEVNRRLDSIEVNVGMR